MSHSIRILCGVLALIFWLGFAHNARAHHWVKGDTHFADNDDTLDWRVKMWERDNPSHYIVIYKWKDGSSAVLEAHDGNPGPDDPLPGKGDLKSRIDLAKQHGGGNWVSEREFWDSPLGQSLTSKGKGPGPVINPGEDNAGGGPGDPSRGKEKLGEPQIIDKTGALGSGKGGGFQFDAGSPADQLKKPGGPGGNQGGGGSDDDDDKGSHKPPPGSNFGPAELVDPLGPPISKRAVKQGKTLKVLKTVKTVGDPHKRLALPAVQSPDSKKKLNPVAPGLLETDAGFSPQGPGAVGGAKGAALRAH